MAETKTKRPPVIRAINSVGGILSRIGMGGPRFTPAAIMKAAQKISGHSDYGDESYRPGLEKLCWSLENEANLNQMGRLILHRQVANALAGRLTVVAWEKANPNAARAPIIAPMFIIGLPRTGTTILFETLAADPALRAPLTWECRDYALAHSVTQPAEQDPRVAKLAKQMMQVDRLMPGFTAIHHFGPFIPTECIGLTLLDMASEQFAALAWMPTYRKFLLENDFSTAYSWHKRGLRYLQSTQPDKAWILKTPMHTGYLGALLKTYPDARFIHNHRDPMQVIASVANLYRVSRSGWSDTPNSKERAKSDAHYYLEFIRRALAFRTAHPEHAGRFFDVSFSEFVASPMPVIECLHTHFERPLTSEGFEAMSAYIRNRKREKYGKHHYSAEQFGFTEAEYNPLFTDYVSHFSKYIHPSKTES